MKNFADFLRKEAEKQHISLSEDNIRQYDHFRNQLLKWNEKFNLTNITEPEEFASKHIIDSLMLCKLGDIMMGARLIDVGTGPGIPGLVVKIYRPDIKLSLLESVGKKTMFLRWIVNDMAIADAEVINDRAENIAHDPAYREKFDVAVARAVAALNTLCELCLPFVKGGGTFIAMKGKSPEDELELAENALDILGGRVTEIQRYSLDKNVTRSLILVSKLGESPSKYPRRPGVPVRKPL